MLIKLEKCVACEGCAGQPGEVVEVDDKIGKALVKGGLAVELKARKADKKETAVSAKKIETAAKK